MSTATLGAVHRIHEREPAAEPLVELLVERVPLPLDELEMAAVLESVGITDEVAREEHGAADVFALAGRLFPEVQALRDERRARPEPARANVPRAGGLGLLLLPLAPLAALVLVLERLDAPSGESTAVALGAATGALAVNALLLPVSHRASVYLGYGQRALALRFLTRAAIALAIVVAVVVALGVAVSIGVDAGTGTERAGFTLAAAALALLLIGATSVVLACGTRWLLAAFAAGAAVAVPLAATGATSFPLDAVAGYAVTLAGLGVCLAAAVHRSPVTLPLQWGSRLLRDAAPAAAYGALVSYFIGLASLVAWNALTERALAATTAVLASLLPVALAAGYGERAMRTLWRRLELAFEAADDPEKLVHRGVALHRRAARAYGLAVGALAVVVAAAFELVLLAGVATGGAAVQVVFLCALPGFALFGLGHFDALFLLGLRRAGPAAGAAAAGVATLAAAVAALAPIDLVAALAALPLGGLVFALACRRAVSSTVCELDWHYAAAF